LPNGDVIAHSGTIFKRTGGTGLFIDTGVSLGEVASSASSPINGKVYVTRLSGTVLVLDIDTGIWSSLSQSFSGAITITYNGSAYATGSDNDVYFQNNDQLGVANLDGGTLMNKAGTGKGTGKSRWEVYTGQKLASGTDMQVETLREYVDENGYHVYISMPVYADNAAAITAGLPVGTSYRTATGDLKIVY